MTLCMWRMVILRFSVENEYAKQTKNVLQIISTYVMSFVKYIESLHENHKIEIIKSPHRSSIA